MRPPGVSTRASSAKTAGLSGERLMTQLEMTTSTESAGRGTSSMTPRRKTAFLTPASRALRWARLSISGGHVEPEGEAGRADAPCGENDVDPAAGAEVEHDLALAQVGDRGRVAAAEAGQGGRLRKLAALLGVVERRAEVRVGRRAAAAASAAAASLRAPGHGQGRLRVLAGGRPSRTMSADVSISCLLEVEKVGQRGGRPGVQRVVGPLPALLALEQAGVRELLQVMADSRLRKPQRLDQLADADRLGRRRERVEDPHPRRVAERAEERRRRLDLLVGQHRRRKWGAARDRRGGIEQRELATHRQSSIYRHRSMLVNPRNPRTALMRSVRTSDTQATRTHAHLHASQPASRCSCLSERLSAAFAARRLRPPSGRAAPVRSTTC